MHPTWPIRAQRPHLRPSLEGWYGYAGVLARNPRGAWLLRAGRPLRATMPKALARACGKAGATSSYRVVLTCWFYE